MAELVVKAGEEKGTKVSIGKDPLIIGRSEEAQLRLSDQGASREHAEIFRIGNACFVRDLESTNNTFLNDEVVEKEELLQPGDRLQIGTTIIAFQESEEEEQERAGRDDESSGRIDLEKDDQELTEDTTEIRLSDDEKQEEYSSIGQERSSRNLSALYHLGKILSEDKDRNRLLSDVLELTADTVDANGAYIFLIDEDSGELVPAASYQENDEEETVGVSRTIIRRVLRTSRSVLSTDAKTDDRFSKSTSVVMKDIRSVIAAPMSELGEVQGVFYLHADSSQDPFSTEDLELVTAIAIQTGVAIGEMLAADKIKDTMTSAVKMLVRAIEEKDPTRKGHSERVAGLCTAIARELGLSTDHLNKLQIGALLHDIGKIVEQDEYPPGMDEEEKRYAHVKQGVELIKDADIFDDILPGIKYHHAKADGSGYPEGVTEEEMPMWVHVLIAANEFDNLLNYPDDSGEGLSVREALEEMEERASEGKFKKEVIEAMEAANRKATLFDTEPSIEAFI